MSNFVVVAKDILQNSAPDGDLQRPRTYVTHDDITYPIYWNSYQKCAIPGKSSKCVRFIHVVIVTKNGLSLERGGRRPSNCLFCRLSPSLSLEVILPARDRFR